MYTDYYLKFDSEADATALLYADTPTEFDEDGNVTETRQKPNYQNIDVLGILYETPPEGAVDDYTPVPIDGWHVNVRLLDGEDGSLLEPYRVDPEPQVWRRVWG